MTTVHRLISLGAQPAEIRMASDGERDYLVMPVVALVGDSVVRPLNSEGPEFVPLAELAVAPGQWAGRPIVADHPEGGTGSANDPRILVAQRYGSVYNPAIRNGKLFAEAWLDPQRAALVGGDAERVVEVARRALAGEDVDPVEVSVGCWVSLIRENGVSPSGVPYEYRWAGLASDHLAVGLNGAPGACSIEDGCGAPRAAKGQEKSDGKGTNPTTTGSGQAASAATTTSPAAMRAAGQERTPMNLMHRILAGLGFRRAAEDEGQSNMDLESALWAAIYAAEPAVQWIADVFQESQTFIYATAPDGDSPVWWRRSYTAAEDGTVTLADDREQVEPVTRYEPLTAVKDDDGKTKSTDHPATARAACGCQTTGDGQAAPATNESESTMSEKVKDLVGRLVANERSPYTKDDTAHLEALGEAKLEALDAALQPAEPEPKPEDAKPTDAKPTKVEEEPDEDTERISAEELADLRAAASAHKRSQAERKASLLAKLKGKQDAYTDTELQAMNVEQLEKVSKLAKVDAEPMRDYSGQGMPVTGDDAVPPPPDIREAIRAARGLTN